MLATLGAGCFWCIEAIYRKLNGVSRVQSGYSGGDPRKITYKEVCDGNTGHAEVCQIEFDEKIISFKEILHVFFAIHDPTTLNRQGNDVGTQYRSVIFYHDQEQKTVGENAVKELSASKAFANQIVTQIEAFDAFYPAENYHDNYFERNLQQPYCQLVVQPKVEKFTKAFHDKLK